MPDTPTHFDLIVIGAGPGGYVAAIRAAQLGLKTACVDKEKALGGTCLRVGCIPSKAMLESSERYEQTKDHLADHGIDVKTVKLDLAKMLARKDGVVSKMTGGIDALFKKNKIAKFTGFARLGKDKSVIVIDEKDNTQTLTAERIIIATGSRSATLPNVDLDDPLIDTNVEALAYDKVPKHLVVIGAGYIGIELGSVWRRLGAKVTVVEYLDRIFPGFDFEIAREAQKTFEKQGLVFELKNRVTGVVNKGNHVLVERESGEPIKADRVLVAVGRAPYTAGLGLSTLGVRTNDRGFIEVDKDFQTNVPGVYAIGDVIPTPMLAHVAEEEGVACVEKFVTGYGHVNYDVIPAIVYTHPEIATVGKPEGALLEEGVEFNKGQFFFKANGRAHALADVDGKVKILADKKTDRVLGVHIIGPRAGDLIAECAAAMEFGATAEDIARTCHAHPTLSEAVKEAALAVSGRAIHS